MTGARGLVRGLAALAVLASVRGLAGCALVAATHSPPIASPCLTETRIFIKSLAIVFTTCTQVIPIQSLISPFHRFLHSIHSLHLQSPTPPFSHHLRLFRFTSCPSPQSISFFLTVTSPSHHLSLLPLPHPPAQYPSPTSPSPTSPPPPPLKNSQPPQMAGAHSDCVSGVHAQRV